MSAQPELEIIPEPTAEERAAIEAAVAELLGHRQGDTAGPGAWWRAGVLEATEETDDS